MTQPVILLSAPQMHENIGAAARAMGNFDLNELRLINPRDGKPRDKAYAMASGADWVLDNALIYDDFKESIGDLHFIIATSARTRDMDKPTLSPQKAIETIVTRIQKGEKCGILFGGERAGLANEEIIHADALVRIPTSENFASLNLAQSVLLLGYEWIKQSRSLTYGRTDYPPATKQDLHYFHEHLENALEAKGFFFPEAKKPSMVQMLKNLFIKASMNEQEVRTMRGVIKALMK